MFMASGDATVCMIHPEYIINLPLRALSETNAFGHLIDQNAAGFLLTSDWVPGVTGHIDVSKSSGSEDCVVLLGCPKTQNPVNL